MSGKPCLAQTLRWFSLASILFLGAASGTSRGEEWSLPDGRMGIRTAPILLLSRPDVQADLKLEKAKIDSVHKTIDGLTQRAQALRGQTGVAAIAGRQSIDEAQGEWLKTNLSDQQFTRLSQIDLQWEGPSALVSRPVVAEHLKLTPSQIRSLTQLISERNSRLAKGASTPPEESEVRRKAMAVLTNPQLEVWNAMIGEHCRFANARPLADPGVRQAGHESTR